MASISGKEKILKKEDTKMKSLIRSLAVSIFCLMCLLSIQSYAANGAPAGYDRITSVYHYAGGIMTSVSIRIRTSTRIL